MKARLQRACRPDPHTPDQRRYNMSRIRSANTKPELVIRRALHAAGLRFRLHDKSLPGSPDLVFHRHRCVVFVNGCFWHGHACSLFRLPATRTEFWESKISANMARDRRSLSALHDQNWRTMIVWECSIRGRNRLAPQMVFETCADFIRGTSGHCQVTSEPPDTP
ncbi:very short patch repair endonuclease [Sphingobium sp. SCG-1]|uniref:very short patch repair endonuclease n=1 Tax=Sphingobium sp. SCG-1 TaxID=2072936 RepID=UPI001CB97F65